MNRLQRLLMSTGPTYIESSFITGLLEQSNEGFQELDSIEEVLSDANQLADIATSLEDMVLFEDTDDLPRVETKVNEILEPVGMVMSLEVKDVNMVASYLWKKAKDIWRAFVAAFKRAKEMIEVWARKKANNISELIKLTNELIKKVNRLDSSVQPKSKQTIVGPLIKDLHVSGKMDDFRTNLMATDRFLKFVLSSQYQEVIKFTIDEAKREFRKTLEDSPTLSDYRKQRNRKWESLMDSEILGGLKYTETSDETIRLLTVKENIQLNEKSKMTTFEVSYLKELLNTVVSINESISMGNEVMGAAFKAKNALLRQVNALMSITPNEEMDDLVSIGKLKITAMNRQLDNPYLKSIEYAIRLSTSLLALAEQHIAQYE